MARAKYRFSPAKALVALHFMVREQNGIDLHTALKSCYFADKEHLNKYGRPIFGATYRAMNYGPVPLEIYEMAKGEVLWLAEMDRKSFPWRLDGYCLLLNDNGDVDEDRLSPSDWECLRRGFHLSRRMSFNARTSATHGPDWQKANLGIMSYEDMLDDTPDREGRIEEIRETAAFVRL